MDLDDFVQDMQELAALIRAGAFDDARRYFNGVLHARYDRALAGATGPARHFVPPWIEIDEFLNVEQARHLGVASRRSIESYFANNFAADVEQTRRASAMKTEAPDASS